MLIRMISNLLAGYLLLLRPGGPPERPALDADQIELLKKRFALTQLSLPRDEYPNLVASADDTADIWLVDPGHWWPDAVDLIIFGLERRLERDLAKSGPREAER